MLIVRNKQALSLLVYPQLGLTELLLLAGGWEPGVGAGWRRDSIVDMQ